MSIGGVPNLLQTLTMQFRIGQLKLDADAARVELVSGERARPSDGVQGRVGVIQQLDKLIANAEHYSTGATIIKNRASILDVSVTEVRRHAEKVSVDLLNETRRFDDAVVNTRREESVNALGAVIISLNAASAGRSLFSGAATDRPPFSPGAADQILSDVEAIIDAAPTGGDAITSINDYFDDPAGVFQTTIYQGSDLPPPSVGVSPNARLNVSVTAKDEAFRQSIMALATVAAVSRTGMDEEKAGALLDFGGAQSATANTGLIGVQAQIGAVEAEADQAIARLEAEQVVFTVERDSLVGVDDFETATRVQTLETQLQAAYLMTQRMTELSLLNFQR